jgi:hypothetical protein
MFTRNPEHSQQGGALAGTAKDFCGTSRYWKSREAVIKHMQTLLAWVFDGIRKYTFGVYEGFRKGSELFKEVGVYTTPQTTFQMPQLLTQTWYNKKRRNFREGRTWARS